jgi:signal transduction histidine kinase
VIADELSGQLTQEQSDRIERMKSKITDLINLIHTWLRVISVDIKKLQDSFKPTSLPVVVSKAVESVQPHAIRKDIEIISTFSKEPIRQINGDEGTLVEALVNILGNAIKFSREGGKVNIKVEEKESDLIIAISDTGIGISREDLPNIFDDFYTGETGKVTEKSSGLGLAITRRIVEAHNGSISVESELGKGSTFTIHLPAL